MMNEIKVTPYEIINDKSYLNNDVIVINNSLLLDSIFFSDVKKVKIYYANGNVFPRYWHKLFKSINFFKKQKQLYHISNSKGIIYNQDNLIVEGYKFDRIPSSKDPDTKIGYYLYEEEFSVLNIKLSINYSQTEKHYKTRIVNSTLSSLSLFGTSSGKMEIESGIIDNWFMRGFSLEEGVTLFNIRASYINECSKLLQFDKCNFDGFQFDNVNFNSYTAINLYRNKFGKATITSCTFPQKCKFLDYPDKKTDNYYSIRYDTFVQLKKVI